MCDPVETRKEKPYCGKLVRHTTRTVIKYFSRCVGSKESETDDSRTPQIMERVIDSIKMSATREKNLRKKLSRLAFYVFF